MKRRKLAVLVATLVMLRTSPLLAEPLPLPGPHVRLTTGDGVLEAPDGNKYLLPTGTHILDGTSFEALDERLIEQENLVTRYKAENESLKKSLNSWTPGWGTLLVLSGLALGTGAVVYFTN